MSWSTCHNVDYKEPNIGGTGGGGGTVTLTGDVTGSGASPIATTISANAVTFAKFQQISTNRLLGRATAGTGNVEEITLGTGLFFSGTTLNATGGTVTSVAASGGTTGLSFIGSPITTSGTVTLSGTLAVANGGTGVTVSTGANSVMLRDANGNTNLVNLLEGYTTTATAAGTTTLTVSSNANQYFTGSTTQTVVMPVTSTLVLGQAWWISNRSTGLVTVNSSGGNAIVILAAGTSACVTCILTSGTTAASWDLQYFPANAATGKKVTVNNILTLAGTDNTTMTFPTTTATIARTDAAQSFTGVQTFNSTPAGSGFTTAATVSTAMLRDANGNSNLVNLLEGYTTTATAASTTTLTVSSAKNQYFTGVTTQTVTMPVTSTLVLGQEYVITNNSTGNVTVQSSGANSIVDLSQNQTARVTCILTSGTTAASWSFRIYTTSASGYSAPTLGTTSIGSGATVTTINGLTLTTTTMTASSNVLGGVTMTLGSDATGDMYYRQGGILTRLPLSGSAGVMLKSIGGIPAWSSPYTYSTKSAAYTLVLTNQQSIIELTGASPFSFTIPLNSSVAFPVGTVVTFVQTGSGALTIAATGGVTINSANGLILNTQYSIATIMKIATDTWILGGDLRVS